MPELEAEKEAEDARLEAEKQAHLDAMEDAERRDAIMDDWWMRYAPGFWALYESCKELPPSPEDNVPGVYFLFNDDELIYIGMSYESVGKRIRAHRNRGRSFDRFATITRAPVACIAWLEVVYITWLLPPENKALLENSKAARQAAARLARRVGRVYAGLDPLTGDA